MWTDKKNLDSLVQMSSYMWGRC